MKTSSKKAKRMKTKTKKTDNDLDLIQEAEKKQEIYAKKRKDWRNKVGLIDVEKLYREMNNER